MKAKFIHEPHKHMFYRHFSTCHEAPLEQCMVVKLEKWRYFCSECGEQNNGEWEFLYD